MLSFSEINFSFNKHEQCSQSFLLSVTLWNSLRRRRFIKSLYTGRSSLTITPVLSMPDRISRGNWKLWGVVTLSVPPPDGVLTPEFKKALIEKMSHLYSLFERYKVNGPISQGPYWIHRIDIQFLAEVSFSYST